MTLIEHVGSDDTTSSSEITGQHSRRGIALRAQLVCFFLVIDRVIKFMIRRRVQEIASDTIHARVLNDNCVTAGAALLDIRTLAIGVAVRAADSGAHVLDTGAGLLTDPHEEHGFDGGEISLGFRVVTFGDALSVAAGKQVVTHDPAAAFAIGCPDGVAIGVNARSPGGCEPGGVVGVFGEGGIPFIVSKGRVPGFAQVIDFVKGRGAGGTGAGR